MHGVIRGAQTRTTIRAKSGVDKVRAADLLKRNFRTRHRTGPGSPTSRNGRPGGPRLRRLRYPCTTRPSSISPACSRATGSREHVDLWGNLGRLAEVARYENRLTWSYYEEVVAAREASVGWVTCPSDEFDRVAERANGWCSWSRSSEPS